VTNRLTSEASIDGETCAAARPSRSTRSSSITPRFSSYWTYGCEWFHAPQASIDVHSSPDSRSEAMIVLKGLDAYMRPGVGEHPNPARVHDGPPVPMDGVDEPAGTVEDPCLGDRGGSARQDREPARKYPDLGQAVGRALRPQAAAVVVELDEDRSGAREVHGYLLNPPVRVRQ